VSVQPNHKDSFENDFLFL